MSTSEIQKTEKKYFYLRTGFKFLVIAAGARIAENLINGKGVIKTGSIIGGALIGKAAADALIEELEIKK